MSTLHAATPHARRAPLARQGEEPGPFHPKGPAGQPNKRSRGVLKMRVLIGCERSRTYAGIAQAMADQWGDYITRQSLAA